MKGREDSFRQIDDQDSHESSSEDILPRSQALVQSKLSPASGGEPPGISQAIFDPAENRSSAPAPERSPTPRDHQRWRLEAEYGRKPDNGTLLSQCFDLFQRDPRDKLYAASCGYLDAIGDHRRIIADSYQQPHVHHRIRSTRVQRKPKNRISGRSGDFRRNDHQPPLGSRKENS
jgi:hypothetical protein